MSSSINSGAHILVIPYPASGHILPLVDLIHQLAVRGLTITILVTPKNLHYLKPLLSLHPSIQTLVLPFPPHPSLPAGVENMQEVTLYELPHIATALGHLYDPILHWFQTQKSPPVAFLSDMLLTRWTQRLAFDLGIKDVTFSPINASGMCKFWTDLDSISKTLPKYFLDMHLATMGSWGIVFNSFTELESEKFEVVRKEFMKHERVWAVGPLLPVKSAEFERGGASSIPASEVMAWLDSVHVDGSVVYVGFGTQITFRKAQMDAVAGALEESKVRFIWAVKDPVKGVDGESDDQSVIPAGFEDRVAERGLVIKGWAPQAAILKHRAVGAYFTHCGWNSVLEAVLGGASLLAWPMQADHYSTAKQLVEELGAAVLICDGITTVPETDKLARILANSVSPNCLERVRAIELRDKAVDAIKEGGSSYVALDALVKQLNNLNSN